MNPVISNPREQRLGVLSFSVADWFRGCPSLRLLTYNAGVTRRIVFLLLAVCCAGGLAAAPAAARTTCNLHRAPQCGGGECRAGQTCVAENDRCVCRDGDRAPRSGATDGTCSASGPAHCGGDCSIVCPAGTRAVCHSGRCAPGGDRDCVCERTTRCRCD